MHTQHSQSIPPTYLQTQVPDSSLFYGDFKTVIGNIGTCIQSLAEASNCIRRDHALLVHKLIPEIKSQHSDILTQLQLLNDRLDSLSSPAPTPTSNAPTRLVSARYCSEEIPDDELSALSQDQLKHLRFNIMSTRSYYKRTSRDPQVSMCNLNIAKIDPLISK